MILPRFRAIMPLATVRPTMKRLVRLVRITSSNVSSLISTSGWRRWMPALLTRMSIGPTSPRSCATASIDRRLRGHVEGIARGLAALRRELRDALVRGARRCGH